jgi:hypothetical protein
MKLHVTLGAIALASAAFVVQPAPAEAGGHVRKHLHDAVHRVGSVILCPLQWLRHHHAAPVYKAAPAKVAYAKKAAAKAAPKPLK